MNRLLFVFAAAAVLARADVTIRYSFEMKPGPMIPAQFAEALKAQMKPMADAGIRMQLKGNRAYSEMFGISAISDFDGQIITFIDRKNERYATAQKDEYVGIILKSQEEQMKALPPEARKVMEQMKVNVATENTGQAGTILGVEAEERRVTMTLEFPGAPAPMRVVFALWAPKTGEAERSAPLRELRQFSQRAYMGTDPMTATSKMFAQMPGFNAASGLAEAFKDSAVALKMEVSMFAPAPGAEAQNAPMMQMIMDMQELSTGEVADSVFQVPRNYTVVPMKDMLVSVQQMARPKPSPADAPH